MPRLASIRGRPYEEFGSSYIVSTGREVRQRPLTIGQDAARNGLRNWWLIGAALFAVWVLWPSPRRNPKPRSAIMERARKLFEMSVRATGPEKDVARMRLEEHMERHDITYPQLAGKRAKRRKR